MRSSNFWAAGSFWNFVYLAQAFTISFHLNKILTIYCERMWLLPVKFEYFSGKNLKCVVTDCKRGHQSKTAVIQLSGQVLIFYSFPYKKRPWISNFSSRNPRIGVYHPLQPTERLFKLWSKSYKSFWWQPGTLEFGRIKFRLKFCPKFFHIKSFYEYCRSSK